jgi:hypothetical protein
MVSAFIPFDFSGEVNAFVVTGSQLPPLSVLFDPSHFRYSQHTVEPSSRLDKILRNPFSLVPIGACMFIVLISVIIPSCATRNPTHNNVISLTINSNTADLHTAHSISSSRLPRLPQCSTSRIPHVKALVPSFCRPHPPVDSRQAGWSLSCVPCAR